MSTQRAFYAFSTGIEKGILPTWAETAKRVLGVPNARHKKFRTKREAMQYLRECGAAIPVKRRPPKLARTMKPIYATPRIPPARKGEIVAWTDGACSKNGKTGAVGGVGVYFGTNDPRNVSEPLEGERQTNQRAEMTAVIRCIEKVLEHDPECRRLEIRTDSRYVMDGMTKWIITWKKNQWRTADMTPVKNKDLWLKIDGLRARLREVVMVKVKSHSGILGNEAADRLAVLGAKL